MDLKVGMRVRVIDPVSDNWGSTGTVKLIDRHQKVWVHIDGSPSKQYESFTYHGLAKVPSSQQ